MRQERYPGIRRGLALAGFLAVLIAPAHSQGLGGASTANPAVATQRLDNLRPPPMPVQRTVTEASVASGLPIERATPGDPTKFFVKKVVFEGSSRIPQAQLDGLAKEYEGREVSLGELNILARRVRAAFRAKGYLVADAVIPSQTVNNGTVKMVISEGRYGKVNVRGNHKYTDRFIKRLFGPALDAGVVNSANLYKSLLILNEYPDLTVQAQFSPGKEVGTTDVLLRVKDDTPVHVGLDYNNFGNRLVGQNRVGATLWAGNSFVSGDELLFRVVEPFPGRNPTLWNAGYIRPVSKYGTKAGFQFADAETKAGGALRGLGIQGDANIFAMVATHPLMRTFQEVRNLSFALTAKTIRNFVLETTKISQDELRVLTLGHDGARGDKHGRWIHALAVNFGLGDFLGGKTSNEPLTSRVGSGNDFAKVNLDVLRSQDFKKTKAGHPRSVLLRFSGQLSTDPLPTAEQFAVGGPDSVRGFIQGERLGDNGFTLSAEYRQELWKNKKGDNILQGVAFLDHGSAELQLPQVGEEVDKSLTGVGVGVRAGFGPNTQFRFDVGLPISQNRNVDGNDAEIYCQAATRW